MTSLSSTDVATVKALWSKISKSADKIGAEALARLIVVYPQTKIYFSHWSSLNPESDDVKIHGQRIMGGITLAMTKIDDLTKGLLDLSELHAFTLRVDPANFKMMCHCMLVQIATMYPKELTPTAHVALDKFLAAVCLALSEKYR